jgi:hypothetical protein
VSKWKAFHKKSSSGDFTAGTAVQYLETGAELYQGALDKGFVPVLFLPEK